MASGKCVTGQPPRRTGAWWLGGPFCPFCKKNNNMDVPATLDRIFFLKYFFYLFIIFNYLFINFSLN